MNESEYKASNPAAPRDDGPQPGAYREPALLRYLGLLWSRRGLVLGLSLGPALLIAGILCLVPRKYSTTFVYERPLAESEYNVLLRRFYSQENLDKMIGRLREQGLTHYIQQLEQARSRHALEDLIRFEVAPIYPRRLQTTDPCTSEKISAFKTRLLSVKVVGNSETEVAGAAAIVTGNLEGVLPLYDVRNQLKDSLQKLRTDAAEIEADRFTLSIDLQKEKAKLEKLQALEATPVPAAQDNLVLHFNRVDKSPEYLPLAYQIRAVQSKIVDLQETLTNNTEKYNFYLQVLDLNNRLLARLEESLLTDYTVQQYLAFVGEQLLACQEQMLCDHLKSYLRTTENLVLVNTRAGEKPVIYPIPRGALKNGALAFVVGLMVAAFVAVLLGHRRAQHGLRPGNCGWSVSAADRTPG